MAFIRPLVVFRASSAFSSLAVTVAMAVLTILALAVGAVQDSKAETNSGSSLLGASKVEDPALMWSTAVVSSLPERSAAAEKPAVMSRKPLVAPSRSFTAQQRHQGPAQEWMGLSKLAIPLLVDDLVGGRSIQVPRLMTGQSVGVGK